MLNAPGKDQRDQRTADKQPIGNPLLCVPRATKITNPLAIDFAKFLPWRSTNPPMATFRHHVVRVVFWRSEKHVLHIHARRVVAFMEDQDFGRYFAPFQNPCDAMRRGALEASATSPNHTP